MAIFPDKDKQEQQDPQVLSLPKVAPTPPITGQANPQQLNIPVLRPDQPAGGANISQGGSPSGLPAIARLQEVRSGDAMMGAPGSAKGVEVIKGTGIASNVPGEVRNLSDMVAMVQGLGLDRAPSYQIYRNNPEYAKMISANKIAQLNALANFVNSHGGQMSAQEVARINAEAKNKPTHQETLLGKMMEQQELGKAQEQALNQFQQGLVGSGAATLDPKTGKATFRDPRYQKLFDEVANEVKGVTDRNALQGIMAKHQERVKQTDDWVRMSDKKVLQALPDDISKHGQDLLKQMRGGQDGPSQLTAEEVMNLRRNLLRGEPGAIAVMKEILNRKERAGIQKEQQGELQKARAAIGATKTPQVWQSFSRITD